MATSLLLGAVVLAIYWGIFLVICFLVYKKTYRNAWSHLPSPGYPLPFLGHLDVLFNTTDPVNYMWGLYNKFSQKGLLYTKILNLNTVLVGDFDTLKYLFNHPDVQNRMGNDFHTDPVTRLLKEERGGPVGPVEGVISSQGKVWAEQRRFTLRTLRDFGFGKSGREKCPEFFLKLCNTRNGRDDTRGAREVQDAIGKV